MMFIISLYDNLGTDYTEFTVFRVVIIAKQPR